MWTIVGPWMGSAVYATPSAYSLASPQQVISPVSHAGTPASSQPYTCYVCSATATSRKNYIAHLQVSAVSLLYVQLHCNQQDNLHCPLESQIHLLQLHLIIG